MEKTHFEPENDGQMCASAHAQQHCEINLWVIQQKSAMRDLKIKLLGSLNTELPNQPYVRKRAASFKTLKREGKS